MKRYVLFLVLLVALIPMVSADSVPRDFYIEVSKGNIPGHRIDRLSGINPSVGIAYEDIISSGGTYVYPVAAVFVNVSSTDVDDTNGGSGAWNVTIEGLDINWNPINETILLNGLTNVTSVKVYFRVNHFYTRRAGASEWNEGTIALTSTNLLLSEIIPNHGKDQYALYSVPNNCSIMPFSGLITSSEDKTVEVELQTKIFGESWHTNVEVFSFRSNSIFDVKGFNLIPEKTDIKIRAKVGATTGVIGSTLNLLLIKDSVLHVNDPIDINIVESIDLMASGFTIFTIFGGILLYLGMSTKIPGDRMLRFGVSFLFWIGSLSQWISDGGGIVPLLVLIAPTLMSLVWMVQALGEVTDRPTKKDIYSVYE